MAGRPAGLRACCSISLFTTHLLTAGPRAGHLRPLQIVEVFEDLDLPRRQAKAAAPQEGIDLGKADRIRAEAVGAAPTRQADKRPPQIGERLREGRDGEVGFVFGPPLRILGALDQPFQRLAPGNAVLVGGVEREGALRKV